MSNPSRPSTELDAAAAHELSQMVEYPEGAVVSRTLAKRPSFSLTLFAFDAGQELSEHTSPRDAFVQVLDGSVELTIGGAPVTAQAGEIVLMPANVPHAVLARERFKMLLTLTGA